VLPRYILGLYCQRLQIDDQHNHANWQTEGTQVVDAITRFHLCVPVTAA
jgi:hypothetical protein